MLKLTRGALTMLLKEYRSILKNAYIKNIAAGALLAGSLAVSSNAYADPAPAPVSCVNGEKCIVAEDETLAVDGDSLNSFKELTINKKASGSNDGKVTITEGKSLIAKTITNNGEIAVVDDSDNVAGIQTSSLTNNGKITTASTDKLTITGKFEAGEASATSQDSEGKYFKTKTDNYGDLTVVVNKDSSTSINNGSLTIGAFNGTVSDKDAGEHDGLEEGKAFTITTNAVGKQTFSAEAAANNTATVKNEATGKLYLNAASTIYANALENAGDLFINAESTIEEFKNTGSITVGDANLADKNITATLTSTAPADDFDVIANSKELTVNDGATVNFNKSDAGDKVLSNAGTITVNTGATLNTDDFVNDGGSVTVNGTFTTAGLLNGFGLNEDSFKDGEISDPTELDASDTEKNAALTVNGTLTVNEASLNRGKITINKDAEATFKDNVYNGAKLATQGDVVLPVADADSTVLTINGKATFEKALQNFKTLTIAADSDKKGNVTVANLANAGTLSVAGTDGHKAVLTVEGTLFNTDSSDSSADLKVGPFADVTIKGDIYNTGTISADSNLDLSNLKKTLTNGGITCNTVGTVKVGTAGTATVTAKADGLGLVKEKLGGDAESAEATIHGKVIVGANGILALSGDTKLTDDVFVQDVSTSTGLQNGGTVKFDSLTLVDADAEGDTNVATFNEYAGKIVANALNAAKDVTVSAGAKVTVNSALNAAGTVTVADTLNLGANEKASGTVASSKITSTTGTTNVTGTWDLSKTELDGKFVFNKATADSVKSIKASADTALTDSTVSVAGNVDIASSGSIYLKNSTLAVTYDNVHAAAATGAFASDDYDSTLKVNGDVKVGNDVITSIDAKTDTAKLTAIYTKLGINNGGAIADNFKGKLDLATVTLKDSNVADGAIAIGTINTSLAAHSDLYKEVQVTGAGTVDKDLNVGSLQTAGAVAADVSGHRVVLNAAASGVKDGDETVNAFISNKVADSVTLAGATLNTDSTLVLNGNGAIGNITAADGEGVLQLNGNVTAKEIGTSSADLDTVNVLSGESSATKVYAENLTVDGTLAVAEDVSVATKATVKGTLSAKNLSVGNNSEFSGNVTVAETLSSAADLKVTAGTTTAKVANIIGKLKVGTYVPAAGETAEELAIASVEVGKFSNNLTNLTVYKGSSVTVTGDEGYDAGANDVTLGEGSSLNVTKTFKSKGYTDNGATVHAGDINIGNTDVQSVKGSLIADNGLTVAKDLAIEKTGLAKASTVTITDGNATVNGTLVADSLKLGGVDKKITVGLIDDPSTDTNENASGILQVQHLNLNNGTLSLDPAYGEAASLATVNSFGSGFNADATTGNIAIGQNSAFGYGVSSAAQLTSALADAGISGFSKNGIANAIYLARGIAVNDGHGIALKNEGEATPVANTVDLGSNSAVVVAENLVKNKTAAITLMNGGAGSVKVQGSNKVILGSGNLTKKDAKGYQVFANTAGSSDLVAGAENVTVSLNSGFYNDTTLNADGTIGEITVDRIGLNYKLSRASAPIKQLIGDVADVCGRGEGLGSDFIYQQALISAGADVEAAARLATYGGAYQAAQSVQDTGSNAALARLGLGADNSSTVKGDNVSLWTSLTYKTKDSDSFEAEGVDYGADVDLAGIVVGADFTTDKGARLGAFFNLGSGSADGKGVGSSIDNDFDYYGLGFYAGTKLADNFELLGDFSFSQISNELKQNVATYGALEGDADMTAISAGILAKYTFNTKVLDVSPYIGVRYSRYDLDSYNVKSYLGTIATTDSKVQNVLSIPVGVGISKTFSNGDWTIKPAADVKLTFNSGDKDVDSVTYFTGAPHGSNLSTEVLDDITYGVSAKVDAQYGATTLGIGINYVGSDNTSEFGLGANARYTF